MIRRAVKSAVFVLLFGLLMIAGLIRPTMAQDAKAETVTVHMFFRAECGHCQAAKAFLKDLQSELPQLQTQYYDLNVLANRQLFNQITDDYNLQKATPITLIRGNLMVGFDRPETTGKLWRQLIEGVEGREVSLADLVEDKAQVISAVASVEEKEEEKSDESLTVTVPLIGWTIKTGDFSLLSLSAVLGLVDGFNPCAMWVLVMLLLMLSQVGDRKRMWQYAGLFIIAQGIMYYLILTVWLAVWDFVALDRVVTPLIGLVALGSGLYFLYKYWTFKPICDVADEEQRSKIEQKARRLINKPLTLAVAIGIIGLALSVNIFEFVCSVGIPQAFTKVLDINGLSWLGRQGYAGVYLLAYIFDDIVVFGLALYSFDKIGLTHKYSKWTTLIGGVLMLLLGVLMLFKPHWLVF